MSDALSTSTLFTEPGQKLLGEVISWNTSGISIRHMDVVDALVVAGLDSALARELCPRHAFARAARKLSDRRIIRPVIDGPQTIIFQFTKEEKHGDQFDYTLETRLELDKQTGKVTCPIPELAMQAQTELDLAIDARTSNDITRITQKLFDAHADLFPIREQGGVYFVPIHHQQFLDKAQTFLSKLGGRMSRFPIAAGTPNGDRSAKEAVAAGMDALVRDLGQAVEDFSDVTRKTTMDRAAQRIREAKFKVEAYAEYLGAERERLDKAVEDLNGQLRAKVEALSEAEAKAGEPSEPAEQPEPAEAVA